MVGANAVILMPFMLAEKVASGLAIWGGFLVLTVMIWVALKVL